MIPDLQLDQATWPRWTMEELD